MTKRNGWGVLLLGAALVAGWLVPRPGFAEGKKAGEVKCEETSLYAAQIEDAMDARIKDGWRVVAHFTRPAGMKVKAIVCFQR